MVDQEVDLPVGIPGRQGAASASLRFPVTKGNYEFIITLRLGRGERGQQAPLCAHVRRSGCAGRGPGGAGRAGGCGAGPGGTGRAGGCGQARAAASPPACPLPTPPGRTRRRFPQPPLFSARRTVAHAPLRSTARLPPFRWARGAGRPPAWCRAPPPLAAPRLSAVGAGALRCLPWRAGRRPDTERGQHRLTNVSRCLQRGICTQRVSKAIACNRPASPSPPLAPSQSHPVDNKQRSRVL